MAPAQVISDAVVLADHAPASAIAGGRRMPTPPAVRPRRVHLKTLGQIQKEMAYTYRQVAGREVDSGEGSRRIYMLSQIAKVAEAADLERRIIQLERGGPLLGFLTEE